MLESGSSQKGAETLYREGERPSVNSHIHIILMHYYYEDDGFSCVFLIECQHLILF